MRFGRIPYGTIDRPLNTDELINDEADIPDIIQVILQADRLGSSEVKKLAAHPLFNTGDVYDDLYSVWAYVNNNITYVADTPGAEKIKTPARLWEMKVGDCKSFSVFIGCMLQNMGIKYSYRFTGYEADQISHIYVVAYPKGRKPVILDATIEDFDFEVPYVNVMDYDPATQKRITGIKSIPKSNFWNWLLVGGVTTLVLTKGNRRKEL